MKKLKIIIGVNIYFVKYILGENDESVSSNKWKMSNLQAILVTRCLQRFCLRTIYRKYNDEPKRTRVRYKQIYNDPIVPQKKFMQNYSYYRNVSTESEPVELIIDQSAVNRLQEILKQGEFLRVFVDSGGCSGFQYKFEVDTGFQEEEDVIFQEDGAKVVTDKESIKFLGGSTVEYHVDLIRAGFRIVNIPKAEKGCSCGVSFSIKL